MRKILLIALLALSLCACAQQGAVIGKKANYDVRTKEPGGSLIYYDVHHFEVFHGAYMLHLMDGSIVYVPQQFTIIRKVK